MRKAHDWDMTTTTTTTTEGVHTPARRPRERWAAAQQEFRERRQVRRAYRALARDLAAQPRTSQLNDLLAAVDRQNSGDADVIRRIVSASRQGR